mgnify:CR=1 FL=1
MRTRSGRFGLRQFQILHHVAHQAVATARGGLQPFAPLPAFLALFRVSPLRVLRRDLDPAEPSAWIVGIAAFAGLAGLLTLAAVTVALIVAPTPGALLGCWAVLGLGTSLANTSAGRIIREEFFGT